MKPTLAIVACFLFVHVLAQHSGYNRLDRIKVEEAIKDSLAETYYPKLMSRLKAYDTSLSIDDYRHLYYGYVFQPGYSPYVSDKGKEIKAAIEKKNYDLAIKYCDDVLEQHPMSLRNYYYKYVALYGKNETDTLAEKVRKQYQGLILAIASTGDGLTCETAFKVITVSDEYDFMFRYLAVKAVISQALEQPCDKITISPSEFYEKGKVYFDVSETFAAMKKLFKK